MNSIRIILAALALGAVAFTAAGNPPDDTARLRQLLVAGGAVTIPPGDYSVGGGDPLPLTSGMKVEAQGARFHLPEKLGDKARVVVFAGTNVTDFAWHGGEFFGHVFDPARQENGWEPNANTRMLVIATTPGGVTSNISFHAVRSHDIAGAVINITGALPVHGEREVLTYASNVTISDCTLLRSGKFMWDYGYLWQQIVWPEDYAPWEVERAQRYFRTDLIRDGVQMADGDDRVRFDNRVKPLKVSTAADPRQALCFFGAALPQNIVRGKQYFVVAAAPDHIKVAEQPGGAPIRFAGASGAGAKLIYNLFAAGPSLYAPTGQGPGKGGVDVVGCRNVSITGCTLSALGDTMHLQRSQDAVFSHNHITGSRMGAFFIAEYCQRVTAASNTVDGSNGSRVMSVEKSATDITIIGNTFCNGGRGSWINQPRNLLMQGNVFSNNTTKCERNPRRGRRSFATGDWEQYAEMYFTTYETGGRYATSSSATTSSSPAPKPRTPSPSPPAARTSSSPTTPSAAATAPSPSPPAAPTSSSKPTPALISSNSPSGFQGLESVRGATIGNRHDGRHNLSSPPCHDCRAIYNQKRRNIA